MLTLLKSTIFSYLVSYVFKRLFGSAPDSTKIDTNSNNAEALRIWLLDKADSFKLLAEKTNITLDDKVLAWITKVLNNAALFELLYNALNGLTYTDPEVSDEPANAGLIRRLRRRHLLNDDEAAHTANEIEPILNAIKTIREAQ